MCCRVFCRLTIQTLQFLFIIELAMSPIFLSVLYMLLDFWNCFFKMQFIQCIYDTDVWIVKIQQTDKVNLQMKQLVARSAQYSR